MEPEVESVPPAAAAPRCSVARLWCIEVICNTMSALASRSSSQRLVSCCSSSCKQDKACLQSLVAEKRPGRLWQAARQLAAPAAAAAAGDASSGGDGNLRSSGSSLQRALTSLAQKHFLPLALSSAVALGAAFPRAGVAATQLNIPAFVTFSIFIVQARAQQRGKGGDSNSSGRQRGSQAAESRTC